MNPPIHQRAGRVAANPFGGCGAFITTAKSIMLFARLGAVHKDWAVKFVDSLEKAASRISGYEDLRAIVDRLVSVVLEGARRTECFMRERAVREAAARRRLLRERAELASWEGVLEAELGSGGGCDAMDFAESAGLIESWA